MQAAQRPSVNPAGAGGLLLAVLVRRDRRRPPDRLGGRLGGDRRARSAPSFGILGGIFAVYRPLPGRSDAVRHALLDAAARAGPPDARARRVARAAARAAGLPHRRLAARRLGARRGALGRACTASICSSHARARGPDTLRGSGVQAFGLLFKLIAILVVLFAALAAKPHVALAAALTYALAYTFELGLSLAALLRSGEAVRLRTSRRRGPRARGAARARSRAGLRPDDGVRAARVDLDPPRPAQPVDHEGRRVSDARHRADDRCSASS